jgi:hypothetical protein
MMPEDRRQVDVDEIFGKLREEILKRKARGFVKKQGTIDYSEAWQKGTGTAMMDEEFIDNLKALGYLE